MTIEPGQYMLERMVADDCIRDISKTILPGYNTIGVEIRADP
jgi:hypothetical protein